MIVSSASLHLFVPSLLNKRIIDPFHAVNNNKSQSNQLDEEEIWIDLHYINWNETKQKGILVQVGAVRSKVSKKYGGWISLDVMETLVSVWLKNPNQNMGLHIKAKSKSGQVIPVGVQYQTTNVSKFVNM